jgi:hypothetical protein
MANDYDIAGITASHNIYILRSVVEDLVKGFYCCIHEHRHIATAYTDIATAIAALAEILDDIETADTSRPVRHHATPIFP